MEREIKHIRYYLELIFKENKMRIALKFLLGFFMFKIISGQELPQPLILGQDIPQKTLKVSREWQRKWVSYLQWKQKR